MLRVRHALAALVTCAVALLAPLDAGAAETCAADGRVCVQADLGEPLVGGSTLSVRVPAETTELVGTGVWDARQVTAGPPGGASLWQVTCCPHAGDIVLRFWARAGGTENIATAEFAVRVVDFATRPIVSVEREGRWLAARWSFEALADSRAIFGLQVYGPKPIRIAGRKQPPAVPLRHPARRVVEAFAGQTVHAVIRLPLRRLDRICRTQPYCQWTTEQKVRRVEGETILPGTLITEFGPRKKPRFFRPPHRRR